jgi:P4 family phage/plasmid primase-like protien
MTSGLSAPQKGETKKENDLTPHIYSPPSTTLEAVHAFRERGWVPIPVEPRGKLPKRRGWPQSTLETPTDDFSDDTNIAINLGKPSGGLVDIDLDSPEAEALAGFFLPETGLKFGRASNPNCHWLYGASDCGSIEKYQFDGEVFVEIRANGANTVFPPSVYEDGEKREFSSYTDPTPIGFTDLRSCAGKLAAASLLVGKWQEGVRHDATLALAGTLARNGWRASEIENFVSAICQVANDHEAAGRLTNIRTTVRRIQEGKSVTGLPTLADIFDEKVAGRLSDWLELGSSNLGHNGPPANDNDIQLTEVGNANRFVRDYGNDVLFCSDLECWFMWSGTRWVQDKALRVLELGKQTAQHVFSEAAQCSDSREREAIVKWARQSCSKKAIEAMLGLAKPQLANSIGEFDRDPFLLNFKNGTVELRTGVFRDHRREDLITKQVPYSFDPDAECPTFMHFLDEITCGEREIVEFLHRALGYSLTGTTDAQCMFIAFGEGANGKSTLLNLFQDMLGDYAMNTPVQTFVVKKNDNGASDDIARLRGARYVTAAEAEANQRLAESLLKRVTGGDTITARPLFKGFFDFKPAFKLWLSTNKRMHISGTDLGIWRRIHEIPFLFTVPDDKRDPKLPDKLKDEAPGILTWAVKGCLEWQKVGLNPPEAVRRATDEYRAEMDQVRQFIEEATVSERRSRTTKSDLFTRYKQWEELNGTDRLRVNDFGSRLKRLGINEGKSKSLGRYWEGIAIRTTDQTDDPETPDSQDDKW